MQINSSSASHFQWAGLLWVAAASLSSHGQTFTLSTQALARLPPVQEGGPDASTWAQSVDAKPGLPSERGIWAIYRHEGLWYWFGPYLTLSSADEALRQLNMRAAALRSGNWQRYKAVMIRRLEVDDAALQRLKSTKSGIPLDILLASLKNLEKLTVLREQLEQLKPGANRTSLESLAATRSRLLRLASDPSRDAFGSGDSVADPSVTTGRELESVRAALGAAVARRTLGASLVEAMQRASSVSTSELIQLEAAGLRAIRKANGSTRVIKEWEARIGGALARIQQGLPQDPRELFADLGEAVLSSLVARQSDGIALQGTGVGVANLRDAEVAARRSQLPDVADILGAQIKRVESRDQTARSQAGLGAGADAFSALEAMTFSRVNRLSEQGAAVLDAKLASQSPIAATSFSAAASVGVRAEAVPELLKDYTSASSTGLSAQQAAQSTRRQLRDAISESLMEEAGVEPGQRGALTSQQRRALDEAVSRRTGAKYHTDGSGNVEATDAVDSAAQALGASAARGEAALTAGDVRNLAAKGSSGGSPKESVDAKAGAAGSTGGKSQGGGQASGGSGGLPLPGYMPLFETLARGIVYAFGVDPSTAKSVLMLAYAINPTAFESIASQMETLHKQLVDAETANRLNDVNKVLNLLDQIQGEYQKIEGEVSKAMQKGVEPVLKDLMKRGAQAASDQAIKEVAARLGIADPGLLRSVMQLPPKWDSGKAASALTDFAKRQALEELEKKGVPLDLGRALLSGDRNRVVGEAKAVVQRRGVEQLGKVGLSATASRALISGDFEKVASELRSVGKAKAGEALRRVGYSEQEIQQALSGTPQQMLRTLKTRSRQQLEEAVARGENAGNELVEALRGKVDAARGKVQAVEKLVEQARISRDVALALVEGNLSSVSAEEMQRAIWNAGQAIGWRALGDLVGVDPRNLRIYAQSPSWASELNKVVAQAPAAFTKSASQEIDRQRALVELTLERERRSYEELLRQF